MNQTDGNSNESELAQAIRDWAGHQDFTKRGSRRCRNRVNTLLAYQLVQVLRTRLRHTGEHASWTTLRRILEGQQRITATFRRTDGRTLHVRKATLAEPPQQAIYDALGIDSSPGGIHKTLV